MRIVSRQQLMSMPAGTVYAAYEPINFGTWNLKADTIEHGGEHIDWVMDALVPLPASVVGDDTLVETFDRMENGEPSGPLDFDCFGRDGMFDDRQRYAVLDPEDVQGLIARLQAAIDVNKDPRP